MADRTRARAASWRLLGALVALVASVGTALVFLLAAYIVATNNCEDGCPVGSPWAPGAWGSVVELWALALPAAVAACSLVCALAMGRIRASAWAWATMTVLLLAWCLFTGVSTVPIDFSASNSHWMWLAGLLSAGGGGLVAIGISSLGSRP